jgi:hypothetical protein
VFDFFVKKAPIVLICAFWGCQEGRYSPDAEFIDLYAELKLASVAAVQDPGRANEAQRAILARHGVTPADFHERFVRLVNHPDAWKPFQERVVSRMEAFQKEHSLPQEHGED